MTAFMTVLRRKMQQNKLKTYLGFAVKSNSIVFGFDNLLETRKKVCCVIYSHDINLKIEQKLLDLCKYKNWALIKLTENDTLSVLLNRENCKVIGITNKDLVNGILQQNINLILRGEF